MTRKQKALFAFLCLLPFMLALSFRAVDNYQFSLNQAKLRKTKSDYYPAKQVPNWREVEKEYSCQKLKAEADSLRLEITDFTD